MSKGSFGIGGFLLGGVVGAALGLLFAPKPGKETREFLADKAKDYINSADSLYMTGREKAVELYSTASDKAGAANTQVREKIEVARARLNAAVSSAAEKAADGLHTVADKTAQTQKAADKVEEDAAAAAN